MVVRLARWQEQNHDALPACGLKAELNRGLDDAHNKPLAGATVAGPRGEEVEIFVWNSGECRLWVPLRAMPMPGTDPRAEGRRPLRRAS